MVISVIRRGFRLDGFKVKFSLRFPLFDRLSLATGNWKLLLSRLPVDPHTVREWRRAPDCCDDDVPRLFEVEPKGLGDIPEDGTRFVVEEHAPGRKHAADVAHRQHQLGV